MGLVRTFYATSGFSGEPLSQDRTTEISLAFLDQDPTLPRRFISVEWRGFWFLPQAQTVDVYAGADDRVDVLVDGQLVLQRSPRLGMHTIGETITLSAGSHTVTVRYEQDGGGMHLNVQRAFAGARPAPFTPTRLFPKVPNVQDVRLATGTYWLLRVVVLLWLLSIAGLLVVIALAGGGTRGASCRALAAMASCRALAAMASCREPRAQNPECVRSGDETDSVSDSPCFRSHRSRRGPSALRRRISRTCVPGRTQHDDDPLGRLGCPRLLRTASRDRLG